MTFIKETIDQVIVCEFVANYLVEFYNVDENTSKEKIKKILIKKNLFNTLEKGTEKGEFLVIIKGNDFNLNDLVSVIHSNIPFCIAKPTSCFKNIISKTRNLKSKNLTSYFKKITF